MEEVTFFLDNLKFDWNITEFIAVAFSILYVILAAKENIYCWTAAAISVSIYIYLCYSAKLYAETFLQFFYLIMAFVGYYNWSRSNLKSKKLSIQEWSINKHFMLIILGAISSLIMGFLLTSYTDAEIATLDSFTTIFSLFATYLVVKKIIENWLYWIVIDIAAVYLYFEKGLLLTSLLFIIYTVIAIFGYFKWLEKLERE
tara:strand:+ start:374 stop:976 length:603 start_codon:yes stop_codon:yes gene_type:complete